MSQTKYKTNGNGQQKTTQIIVAEMQKLYYSNETAINVSEREKTTQGV